MGTKLSGRSDDAFAQQWMANPATDLAPEATDPDQLAVTLSFKDESSQCQLVLSLSKVDTSHVQRLKRTSCDLAYMQSHQDESYESDPEAAQDVAGSKQLPRRCYRVEIRSVRIPRCLYRANMKSGGFLKYLLGAKRGKSIYAESMVTIKEYEEVYGVFYSHRPA